jgi:hypothetical protein
VYYDWPVHVAAKRWVNTEAFIEAFSKALDVHAGKYLPPVDSITITASIAEARNEASKGIQAHVV